MTDDLPLIMTIEEASKYLRIPLSSLYKLAQDGKILCQKVGRHWRFRKETIDHWLDDRMTNRENSFRLTTRRNMEVEFVERLVKLRLVIGYLGEREQFGWWQSSFFTQGSNAFLSPLFSRTQILAQCNGVTHAAALVHDERIGIGHVYHLFRLPEEIEQGIPQSLHEPTFYQSIQKTIAKSETALDSLCKLAGSKHPTEVGPIRIGNIVALRDLGTWQTVAGAYLYGFEQGIMVCPYFSDIL